jgi:hypothetical protein
MTNPDWQRPCSVNSWTALAALGLATLGLFGCDQPGAPSLLVATSWPRSERERIESEFQKWSESSNVDPGRQSIRIEWLTLASGDDIERLTRRRFDPDVLLIAGVGALERLERDGQLLPITSTGGARWCLRPRVITERAGPTDEDSVLDDLRDPRVDGPSLAWTVKVLERHHWREGYATLVKLAAHEPRIGGRASAGRRPAHHDASVDKVDFSPRECAAILRSTRDPAGAREFVRFLTETRAMEAAPTASGDGLARDRDVESLVGDLLGATLVDAQDELWAAWRALGQAGSPELAHKWLVEPPSWPPASIEKYLKREGERAMSLIETLAAELSPRPEVRGWLIRSWLKSPRLVDQDLLAEMAHAADGSLVHEPRFRSWLRAEWTASARQRYRRVAKLAATVQTNIPVH